MEETPLQKWRRETPLPLPRCLRALSSVGFEGEAPTASVADEGALRALFPLSFGQPLLKGREGERCPPAPLRVGIVFSGGQAAGGHNVIAGVFDAIKAFHGESRLFGFLQGPAGVVEGRYQELEGERVAHYRNQGGFDLIGSGRTKIETEEQLKASLANAKALALDGLVIIGGDDSNTNAALLAEYFLANRCGTRVVGVPKTIDGDLQNAYVQISFGFDSACKVYAEMIGNIARDALSAGKYYHFIRLMGRSASHIALECALATHPNLTLIGEEVAAKQMTLEEICDQICALLEKRKRAGRSHGVILIPEGLIEFVPEVGALIKELNALADLSQVRSGLSKEALHCFDALPEGIQRQLLLERDPHGNVQVSLIETERLLIEIVKQRYRGKFNAVAHFFGYEGRSGFPSLFDSHYCYALGTTAALLVRAGHTGYMSCVRNLTAPVAEWEVGAVPLTMLMHLEERKGKRKPVIQKALVDLEGPAFRFFAEQRQSWEIEDRYRFPGPTQFFGDPLLTSAPPALISRQ